MTVQKRMSPLTALFLGIFGVGAVGIAAGSSIVLYAMRILDTKGSEILGFAEGTVAALPSVIDALPPAINDLLNDRRAPEYARQLDIDVRLTAGEQPGSWRPVLTITNQGEEVVSMLAVRVAVLLQDGVPVREWTEVVATPIAIDDDWRGPLFPHATRHVVLSRRHCRGALTVNGAIPTTVAEVSEIRLWEGQKEQPAATSEQG